MLITYQLTADDFQEATAHVRRSPRRRKLAFAARTPTSRIIWVVILLLVYSLLRYLIPFMESPERATSPLDRTIDLFLPFLAPAIIYVPLQMLVSGFRTPNWRLLLTSLITVALILFSFLTIYFSASLSSSIPTPPISQSLAPALAPHVAWLALMLGIAILILRAQRLTARVAWLGQQNLHLPFTIDATVDAFIISTSNLHATYPWHAIRTFVETPHLFLLHVSDLAFHIIPKRSFTTANEQTAFQNMVRNLITPSIAFPVLPASSSAQAAG